jgi:hypothetical protein
MAKKDPYKNIQKRFVQARAGDVEYEDLSVEQREQFQNRFNTLAQSVEGRTKIAQRLLPTSTPEQRAQLKQRIRKNLPSGGGPGVEIDMPGDDTRKAGGQSRLVPTSANIRDMQAGYRMQGAAIETRKSAPTTSSKETVTTSKATTSDRYGSGFFSVPKSFKSAVGEVVSGVKSQVDYINRAYVNPVINLAGRGADIVGGRTGDQKFKPLPELSNKEIGIESAITVATAGAGLALKPLVRPSGQALGSIARALTSRGAPGAGAALSNISIRQQNLAAVRAATQLADAGAAGVRAQMAYGTDIGTGTVPKPSGMKFQTPTLKSSVDRPASPTKVVPTTSKKTGTKATTPKPPRVVQTKSTPLPTVKEIEAATEKYAGSGATGKFLDTPGQGPTVSSGKSFNKEFGDIEMTSTSYEPSFRTEPAKPKAPKKTSKKKPTKLEIEIDNAMEPMSTPADSDDILEILNRQPTRKEIEEATENYAPGFNESIGDILMPGTDREMDNYLSSVDDALNKLLPSAPKKQPKSKIPKLIDKEAKTEQWVKKGGKIQPTKVTKLKNQKKNEIVQPAPAPQVAAPVVEPSPKRQVTIVESASEKLYKSMRAEEAVARATEKAKAPDFVVRKRTVLPKAERRAGVNPKQLNPKSKSTAEQSFDIESYLVNPSGSSRLYGGNVKKPSKNVDYAVNQPLDVDMGTSPRQYSEAGNPFISPRELQKIIQETIIQPEQMIRSGRMINPRITRAKLGDMPTTKTAQAMAKGADKIVPTMPVVKSKQGLSSTERINEFYREAFPQARSTREARKLYYQDLGQEGPVTTFRPTRPGKALNVPKTPRTEVEVAGESVPAIRTAAGDVPISELPERWMRGGAQALEEARLAAKAETLRSQALGRRPAKTKPVGEAGSVYVPLEESFGKVTDPNFVAIKKTRDEETKYIPKKKKKGRK